MYKDQIEDFPQEIVEKMLFYQEKQGNERNVEVFENYKADGFLWRNTPEGVEFWRDVISKKKFHVFYKRYPKTVYPKVMMVALEPITFENPGVKRVVFMEKNGKFLTWDGVETIEEAKKISNVSAWNYAQDINTTTVELTFKDISEGKGVGIDPSLIRIKECK